MSQIYSVPSREEDKYALPDVEVFQSPEDYDLGMSSPPLDDGWYYWHCFPGCLPDSDPIGPFDTEAEAIEEAQADSWQFEAEEGDTEESYFAGRGYDVPGPSEAEGLS